MLKGLIDEMSDKNKSDQDLGLDVSEYLDMFIEESEQNLQIISEEMLRFEQDPNNLEIVAEMFRAAHTLKGMAGTMGFAKTEKLTHTIENKMDDIRNGIKEADEAVIDFMFKGVALLEKLLDEIKESGRERSEIMDLISGEKGQVAQAVTKTNSSVIDELSDLEKEAAVSAYNQGQKVYEIDFRLDDECVLKSIRVQMFFKKLSGLGEMLKVRQSEEEIENESFNGELQLIFISDCGIEDIENLAHKLSEVKSINASQITDFTAKKPEAEAQVTNNENKNTSSNEKVERTPIATKQKADKKTTDTHRKSNTSIRVNLEKIESLMGLFEEFVVEKGRMQNIANRIKDKELIETIERISRNSTEMQSSILSMRMVPLETILNRFSTMVRNTSKDLGKNINFIIEGAETELDRTVVDELGDPLVHLVRNSLDHGIELPESRKERGKNEQGTILLQAYHKGNEAVIEIKDDGNGINVDKIKNKLITQNVLTQNEVDSLTDEQIIQYIFSSGLSTADKITNLSGRGVGLDVVKTKIESLGGSVRVESEMGVGSKFIIVLPLTLSIVESLLVREGSQTFAVPLSNVKEILHIEKSQIKRVLNKQVLYSRGEVLNVYQFGTLFNNQTDVADDVYALIIQNSLQKYALLVDEIIGQQEIVLKPLQGYTKYVPGVTGATILGDGSISFVFDVSHF
jgi:two-component system chemotaxis sensor kinase CheA